MKQAIRTSFFAAALTCVLLSPFRTQAQTPSPDAIPVPPPAAASAAADNAQAPEHLKNAEAAYGAGHYKQALDEIAQAQARIRLKHAALYRPLLPAAATGWKSEDGTDNSTLNLQVLGGLSMVSRKYTANGHAVSVSFVIDASPLVLASLAMQPLIASDNASSSSETIKGNKGIYKESKNAKTGALSHSLTVIVNNVAVMVTSATLGKDTLLPFANSIDYDAIKKID